jgi:hypothetical protein
VVPIGVFEANETGLHAALGVTKSSQSGLVQAQQRKVLGELALKKFGIVFTGDFDNTQVIQSGNAVWAMG